MTTGTTGTTPLPPDSWPGAGGRRSIAPEVAPWPGVAPKSESPGASWPGAAPARSTPAPGTGGSGHAAGRVADRDLDGRLPGGRVSPTARLMWGLQMLLVMLVPLLVVVTWIVLDDMHRPAQLAVFGVLTVLAAVVIVGVPLRRHQVNRWEVADGLVRSRTGSLTPRSRTVPVSQIRGVGVAAGPLERAFGLATLTIAAEDGVPVRICGLEDSTARRLVEDLTRAGAPGSGGTR